MTATPLQVLHRWLRAYVPEPAFARGGVWTGNVLRLASGGPGIHTVRYSPPGWILECTDGAIRITSPRRLSLYRRGLQRRLGSLRNKYLHGVALRADDVVIDIGANIGEFSLAIADEVRAVLAVEPDPLCCALASLNLQGTPNAVVVQRLLLDQEKQVLFHQAPEAADSSVFGGASGGKDKAMVMAATTLDALTDKLGLEASVIKMDAEGAEPEVLTGASRSLAAARLVLVDAGPERNGESTAPAVSATLLRHGYRLLRDGGEGNVVVGERL